LAKDYIILEVWTNGSIHPPCNSKAAKALINCFTTSADEKYWLKFRWTSSKNLAKKAISSNSTSKKNSINPIFKKDRSHSLTLNQKSDTVLAKQNYQSDPRILNLDIGNLDLTLAPYSLKTGKY
jgi:hypothetical protein